jgi:putative hemolysin
MTERITSMPEQASVACVQLPGQEIELAHDEMANTSGGCILPGGEHNEPFEDIIDAIEDAVSEWWPF